MERNLSKWTLTAAMVFMFCLAGLIVTGTAFGDQCVYNQDGTVTDNNTDLIWQKATAGPMNWYDAMSYASGISLGGHSDWRLPTIDELKGLYNSPCKGMMDVVQAYYWSSSPCDGYPPSAYVVGFDFGDVFLGHMSNVKRVRAVCAGQ